MSMPSGMELLVIFGIVVLLFGAKKIPDLAKGIGQGIRNFKKEMKEDAPATVEAEAPKKIEKSEEVVASDISKTQTKV